MVYEATFLGIAAGLGVFYVGTRALEIYFLGKQAKGVAKIANKETFYETLEQSIGKVPPVTNNIKYIQPEPVQQVQETQKVPQWQRQYQEMIAKQQMQQEQQVEPKLNKKQESERIKQIEALQEQLNKLQRG